MGTRWAEVLRIAGIGWYIAACILLGTLGGRWVGQKLDSSTSEIVFILLGLALGLIVAFFGTYRILKAIASEEQNKDGDNS